MQYKRIWKHGHSHILTLSAPELNHLGVQKDDYIAVVPIRGNKIRLQKPPRRNSKGVPR